MFGLDNSKHSVFPVLVPSLGMYCLIHNTNFLTLGTNFREEASRSFARFLGMVSLVLENSTSFETLLVAVRSE